MSRRVGYLVAMVAATAAFGAVVLLHPALDGAAYMVFLVAVVGVAVFSGLRPALLTTLLAVAAIDFFFLAPRHSLVLVRGTDT